MERELIAAVALKLGHHERPAEFDGRSEPGIEFRPNLENVPINGRVAQCALREIMQLRSSGRADYLPNRHGPEKRDGGSGGEPAPPRSMGPCGSADPHSGEDGFTQAGRRLHFAQFRTNHRIE